MKTISDIIFCVSIGVPANESTGGVANDKS